MTTFLPRVALTVPPFIHQHADIVARADFFAPPVPGTGDVPARPTPPDVRFRVRLPDGSERTHTRVNGTTITTVGDGALHFTTRALQYGDWFIRVEATVLVGGAKVNVADEKLVHVASSGFA